MWRSNRAFWLVLPFLLTGCLGQSDSLTGTPAFTGTPPAAGGASIDPALVGRWSRTIFFEDQQGSFTSSQLIWEFNADGGARRITVTSNFALGSSFTEVVPALWRVEANTAVVTFLPPGSGTTRLAYDVAGTRLALGPFVLERIS